MTTYKKLTWDSYKIQVESAVRDGNGATITTTYATKTELSTGLGNKLDTTVAASTYLTITDAASTYAPIATTLAGYGITDGVTTNTAQTIDGLKTFSSPTDTYTMIWKSKTVARGDAVTGFTRLNQIQLQDKNGDAVGYIQNYLDGAGNTVTNYGTTSPSGSNRELRVVSGTDGYATVPYRTYNSANINDIVTIGSLAANPSVIHATGNETKSGVMAFDNTVTQKDTGYLKGDKNNNTGATEVYQRSYMIFQSLDGVDLGAFNIVQKNGATKIFVRVKNSDGTWKDVAVAQGNGY